MPKVPTLPLILLPATLLCGACVGGQALIATPSACSSLLPADWLDGVASAPLPEGNTVGDWLVFGDAQTERLDAANGRYKAGVGIISRCEERDKQAVDKSRPRFLGIF